ncbi:MAG: alpha/beta fold hydrolase [Pirellulaceae bacterium]
MKSIASDLLPYTSHEIDVHGFKLRYLDEGHGDETLLCVHGNPTWSYYYRSIVDRFRDNYRVIAVDHLGCGRSDRPRRDQFGYTMADHRDNLVTLIDQLNLKNITLIAHDWGGAIGLASLVARRERFRRIVLLNTGAFPPPYVPKRIALLRLPLLGPLAIRGLNLFAGPAITMAMSRNQLSDDVARGLLAPYRTWAQRVAIDSFVRDIPLTKKHPTYETLRQLESDLSSLADMPSMLVWGMKDWCFNSQCLTRFQAAWPNATTVEIPDAGHYVIEDAPTETVDAISEFLSQNSVATSNTSVAENG